MIDNRPAPLVPTDADITGLSSFLLDAGRLLDSHLWAISTGDEFKAAMALWCRAWQEKPAGSLPNDERLLAGLSGAGTKWKKVRNVALRGFVECSDGRLYHKTLCEDVLRAHEKKKELVKRAQGAAHARWASKKGGKGTSQATQDACYEHATSMPDALHEQCMSNAPGMPINISSKEENNLIAQHTKAAREEDPSKGTDEVAIRREICSIVDPGVPPGDMHRVGMWLAQGYSPGLIRAVVVGKIREGKRPSSLAWFDKALAEAATVKAPAGASSNVIAHPHNADDAEWTRRVEHWLKFDRQRWSTSWGPSPRMSSTLVPRRILEALGVRERDAA